MSEVPAETIRRCQAGDIDALGVIYCATGERVFRIALRLLAAAHVHGDTQTDSAKKWRSDGCPTQGGIPSR